MNMKIKLKYFVFFRHRFRYNIKKSHLCLALLFKRLCSKVFSFTNFFLVWISKINIENYFRICPISKKFIIICKCFDFCLEIKLIIYFYILFRKFHYNDCPIISAKVFLSVRILICILLGLCINMAYFLYFKVTRHSEKMWSWLHTKWVHEVGCAHK